MLNDAFRIQKKSQKIGQSNWINLTNESIISKLKKKQFILLDLLLSNLKLFEKNLAEELGF